MTAMFEVTPAAGGPTLAGTPDITNPDTAYRLWHGNRDTLLDRTEVAAIHAALDHWLHR